MAKKKWYVVWEGKTPGIYTDWESCKQEVNGIHGAKYKSFTSESEAKEAYLNAYSNYIGKTKTTIITPTLFSSGTYNTNSLSVDAACSGNPGQMEYQGVWTETKEPVFKSTVFPIGTNNIGEFLGIIDGIQYLTETNQTDKIIYTDSKTAMAWIKHKKVKTMLDRFPETELLWQKIDAAIDYLQNTTITISIEKWETEAWGEIHADFGRK